MQKHCTAEPRPTEKSFSKFLLILLTTLICCFIAQSGMATPTTNLGGYGLKIFRVESGLYPFVHVYARTYDQEMQPLVNLNELNIGVMVKGHAYDVTKGQYMIQSIRNRDESIRTILVLDTSKTMAGEPINEAVKSMLRFIDAKRPQDQVAIIAISDKTEDGYQLVSNFERDNNTLGRRLADVADATSRTTSLYDAIGASMQMCAAAPEGGIVREQAEYTASCSVVVFSDGKDEGSALTRSDLMNRITNLDVPIPIYSLAFSRVDKKYLKNLQALSKNSFGQYYTITESLVEMTRSVENIHNIIQNDYVITFRSYVPIDGENHSFKIGVEYPSRSGRFRYQSARFEAIQPISSFSKIQEMLAKLNGYLKPLEDHNPYLNSPDFSPEVK